MSHRPIKTKQINRIRKMMRRTPETFIDPVQWLLDRRYAQTTGEAVKIILAGRLKSESHPIGTCEVPERTLSGAIKLTKKGEIAMVKVPALVPSSARGTLHVVSA